VDLGSAGRLEPVWLRRKLAPEGAAMGVLEGQILALDLLPMEPVEGVSFIQGDFREPELADTLAQALAGRKADVVVSDMAPNLSGIASSDAARIAHLVELAVEFAEAHLKPEGALVCKVFHGSGYSQLAKLFKERFRTVKPMKPKASATVVRNLPGGDRPQGPLIPPPLAGPCGRCADHGHDLLGSPGPAAMPQRLYGSLPIAPCPRGTRPSCRRRVGVVVAGGRRLRCRTAHRSEGPARLHVMQLRIVGQVSGESWSAGVIEYMRCPCPRDHQQLLHLDQVVGHGRAGVDWRPSC
jgi:23S rRNA U2552 (ribose-2'-O)-methylase RlmE/FtsJ